jgi:hypothetical protein
MIKETVKLTEVKLGDKMDFWGEIREIKEVEISKSGKTIRFKLDDGEFTTWWRVNVTVEIIK